ncbi:hypothetical protein [Streptomyces durhamensis]|uniref:hypothetical protein n=1 Tax=Streptomyces durhamensis TaxID=68194 RepID=UPI0012FF1A2C|nr:hypothetical protein [Streptomyces durhamensis]
MAWQRRVRTRRQQAWGTAVCGVVAAGLFALTGYLADSAMGHLGLMGHPLALRPTHCWTTGPSTTSRGGSTGSDWDCTGPAASGGRTHRITATGFTSYPVSMPVRVAQEPWGTWVPVDQGGWNKAGRALSPLLPLVIAVTFARWTLISYRGWRNSRRLPTGSSE